MSLQPRIKILILQHPQEPHEKRGTVSLLKETLGNVTLKTGLSWPNLSKALGQETENSKWAVLYLGSGIKSPSSQKLEPGLYFVDKKALLLPKAQNPIQGLVVLDGTWSQAKSIWWRNAWLLKLKRVILIPSRPSLYGNIRKEPRKECVSTLEAVAETLTHLGESPEIENQLKKHFEEFLKKERKTTSSSSATYPSPS